jgi:putative addiction module CopG family antidote
MSTLLSPANEQFICEAVATGRYRSRTEVLDRAVELLQRREALVGMVNEGVEQLNQGEFTEYDEQALDRFLEDNQSEAKRVQQLGTGP